MLLPGRCIHYKVAAVLKAAASGVTVFEPLPPGVSAVLPSFYCSSHLPTSAPSPDVQTRLLSANNTETRKKKNFFEDNPSPSYWITQHFFRFFLFLSLSVSASYPPYKATAVHHDVVFECGGGQNKHRLEILVQLSAFMMAVFILPLL